MSTEGDDPLIRLLREEISDNDRKIVEAFYAELLELTKREVARENES